MKQFSKNTKTFKLFDALYSGEKLTPAQITKRFDIQNPRAEVTRIRQSGYPIYVKRETAGNSRKVTRYEMGQASRKMVALAYKARQLGITV